MKAQASALLLVACCLWTAEGQGEPPKKSIWEDPIQFNTKAKDTCTMIVTGQGDLTKLRVSCKNQDKTYWCEYAGKPQVCRSYNNNPRHYFTQIMWDLRKLPNACQAARVIKPQMCKRAPDEAQMVFQTSWPRLFTPRPVRPTQERQPARPEQPKPEAPKPEVPRPEEPRPEEPRPEEPRPQEPRPEAPRPEASRPEAARPAAPRPDQPRPDAPKPEAPRAVAPKPEVSKPDSPRLARPPQPRPQPAKPEPGRPLSKIIPVKKVSPKPTKTTPGKTPQPITKANAKKMAQDYCWKSLEGICAYVLGWFQN
ncbi:hypothetical protein COCON_G00121200 [Conger conger]|uniref:Uncharacterized protein n=1 Tax=Conger conger TaxID=82655 RepID=A0A9Q1HX09_CONCO|nr:fibroblast growth factor binding protein 2a [Conger conger]KAJ8269513.1 hypothetical protein COCON_G00121200 [Conger conger]